MLTHLDLDLTVALPLGEDELQHICDTVLAAENVHRSCYLSLSTVDERRMRELNREWRGQDRPTDVISLECERPDDPDLFEDEPCELGDIILSPSYIERQAAGFGTTFADECRLLVVHALLHLLGYDHIENAEAEAMEAREDELLQLVGTDAGLSGITLTRHEEERVRQEDSPGAASDASDMGEGLAP